MVVQSFGVNFFPLAGVTHFASHKSPAPGCSVCCCFASIVNFNTESTPPLQWCRKHHTVVWQIILGFLWVDDNLLYFNPNFFLLIPVPFLCSLKFLSILYLLCFHVSLFLQVRHLLSNSVVLPLCFLWFFCLSYIVCLMFSCLHAFC